MMLPLKVVWLTRISLAAVLKMPGYGPVICVARPQTANSRAARPATRLHLAFSTLYA
jgi:hypothetical protein